MLLLRNTAARAAALLAAALILGFGLPSGVAHADGTTAKVVTTCNSGTIYTAGQYGYPTVDVNGNLCDLNSGGGGGGTSSTFNAGFPLAGTAIGVKNGANMTWLTADGSNNLNVNCTVGCSAGSVTDHTSTATVTAVNNAVSVPTSANGDATILVTANTNVTLVFEGSSDGSNWVSVNGYPVGGGASVTGVSSGGTGTWAIPVAGLANLRARVTAVGGTPTATVTVNAGNGSAQPNVVVNPTAANLNATVVGTGTFAVQAAQSGSWAVTANAGTNLNTSALALDASVNGLLLAQGSATSGKSGPLIQGAVTTAAPTYTTAQTDPLSLTTAGALRVDGSGVTQPVSGTVTANAGSGTFNIQANAGVNIAQVGGSSVVTAATGVIQAGIVGNAGAIMDAAGQNAVSPANELLIAGQFNTSPTTITSGRISPIQLNSTGAVKTDGSGVTQPVSGTVTANAGTGTFNIQSNASVNIAQVGGSGLALGQTTMANSVPVAIASNQGALAVSESGTWTVQPGNTANTTPWLMSINDGTNTAKVQAASTSAAAADKALVVAQSPNPAPVCTSVIAVNQTASTDLHTFTNKGYICSLVLISATQQNISLTEGTGTTCATGAAALMGGTTASVAVAANGGISSVAGIPWLKMQTSADHLCLLQSGAGNVSGTVTYADAA